MSARTGIGVDIGGSHIVSSGVNLETMQPIEGTLFTSSLDRKASTDDIFQTWADPILKSVRALNGRQAVGVGFAMPGAFNYREGIALFAGNDKYEALHRVNVRESFAPYLSMEPRQLRFINDATAFGIGTAANSPRGESERMIAITLGTGFGSTFISGGRPVLEGEGVPAHGCLWHLPFREGIADDYFSTRWFVSAYETAGGVRTKGVKEIADRAREGRSAALRVFARFGQLLGEFLSPWLAGFSAQRLVIGGNISRAWDLIEPAFLKAGGMDATALAVETSALMEEAAIVGSARLLDDRFWTLVKDELPRK